MINRIFTMIISTDIYHDYFNDPNAVIVILRTVIMIIRTATIILRLMASMPTTMIHTTILMVLRSAIMSPMTATMINYADTMMP